MDPTSLPPTARGSAAGGAVSATAAAAPAPAPVAPPPPPPRGGLVDQALAACRSIFFTAAGFSFVVNVLMLVPVFYMLQIYDRVLASGSQPTLGLLTAIAVFLFLVMGGLEWLRSQMMVLASQRFDGLLGGRTHDAVIERAWQSAGREQGTGALTDLAQLRGFLTGPGLFAFFDVPWLPIYVIVMFAFHAWLGWLAVLTAVAMLALALWSERSTAERLKQANEEAARAAQMAGASARNAQVATAMGMVPALRERWQQTQNRALALQHEASRRAGMIAAVSRTFRLTVQSLALGLGAWLALRQEISPGVVIAGSILLGKALAPIDQAVAHWRSYTTARDAYRRLALLLGQPEAGSPMPLPLPLGALSLHKLTLLPPGAPRPVLSEITLELPAGQQLGLIGASAAGKSTLLRTLAGLHAPTDGSVKLDGAELPQYDRTVLGSRIGYLPQDVELIDGTVAENIARFGVIDPDAVVRAARTAGVHTLVLGLPNGYETRIDAVSLSAGQRQRVALARALYGQPALVLLDEPNANLDEEGDRALGEAMAAMRGWGATVVVATHRSNLLDHVDAIALLVGGQLALFGPRDAVRRQLEQVAARQASAASARRSGLSVVEGGRDGA